MRSRFIVALVVASCSTVLTIGLTAPLWAQQEPGEPCCNIKSINARTRMVTLTEKKTSCTYEVQLNDPKDVSTLKTGAAIAIDLTGLVPTPGPTGATGQAASSGTGTAPCGSNVPRNANTKAVGKCYKVGANGKLVEEPCR